MIVVLSVNYNLGKQAGSGDAVFSDGKTYRFHHLPQQFGGGLSFYASRRRDGVHERFSFKSKARAQALSVHLADLDVAAQETQHAR